MSPGICTFLAEADENVALPSGFSPCAISKRLLGVCLVTLFLCCLSTISLFEMAPRYSAEGLSSVLSA